MRIALICVSLRGGGTERIVSRIANHLSREHEVAVITIAPKEPFYPLKVDVRILQQSAESAALGKPLRLVRQIIHLHSSIRNFRPNLCMIFGEDIAGPATLLARTAGAAKIWNFFRGRPERSVKGVKGLLNRLFCRLANRIFVQTTAGKEALSGYFGTAELTVWPNPIALPELVAPSSERNRVILNVGSIGRLKNQQALIGIFADLRGEAEDWELRFVGDGPDRPVLETRASSCRAGTRIRFSGEQREVAPHLNEAAIFAFTSLSEGFPNALAEALAYGCACISYDCPTGPAELIEDGVNGFLVSLGDEAEFTKLLQALIEDGQLRATLAENARLSMRRFEANHVLRELDRMIAREKQGAGVAP